MHVMRRGTTLPWGHHENILTTLALGLIFLVASCAPSIVMLVHPKTGERVTCSMKQTGGDPRTYVLATMTANSEVQNCAQQYESLGFIRADNLTAEQRAGLTPKPTPVTIEQDITIRSGETKK